MLRVSLIGLLALAGCGGADPDATARRPATLTLEPFGRRVAPEPLKSYRVLKPSPESWHVEAASHAFEPAGAGRKLSLTMPPDASVRVSGPFDPRAFNQIAVVLEASSLVELALELLREGKPPYRVARRQVQCGGERATVLVDVPATPERAGAEPVPFSAVRLVLRSPSKVVSVASIELLFRPWERWLPAPHAPALVRVQSDARRAVGLAVGEVLTCDLVAEAGTKLAVSCAIPAELPAARGPVRLVAEISGGGRAPAVHPIEIVPQAGRPTPAWHDLAIDLAPWAGRRVRARFRLEARPGVDAMCALALPHVVRSGTRAPTVLLVTSDTHRADHLGVAPDAAGVRTPALDALAARGVLFEDCLSQTNATRPSHAALMTATHPRDHGLLDNVARLGDQALTLAETFREAGYLTFASVSATPVAPITSGLEQGFERYAYGDRQERPSSDAIEDVLAWLPDADGAPLFVWLHVFDAHAPYRAPAELVRQYAPEPDAVRRPIPKKLELGWRPPVRDAGYVAAAYKAEIDRLDRELARVLDHPRFADAIVAFTADHGESLGAHEHFFTHAGLYPDTVRVPLILAWPGGPRGERATWPVRQLDVSRTLLDLARIDAPSFPGRSVLDQGEAPPRFALSAHGHCASVTHGGWHLIVHLRDRPGDPRGPVVASRRRHQTELYHLPDDPGCERDLVRERASEARTLRELLVDWLLAAPAEGWTERAPVADAEMLAQLAALGYTTDVDAAEESEWWEAGCACSECALFE